MKSLFSLIFLFLFANSAFAVNLCDTSCNLTITFPTGGSITAVEPLTFTFGDTGLVDTVATSTAYVNGNTLPMGTGEVLTFGAGGSLDLGTGGNLDYTNISIITDGNIDIQSIGGTESVLLNSITIVGTGVLTVTGSDFVIGGDVTTNGDVFLISLGAITIDQSLGLISASSLTVTAVSIGTADAPFLIDAYNLSLTTTGIGDAGDIYISSTGSISLDSSLSTTCTTSPDGSLTISTITTPTLSICNTNTIGGTITYTPPTIDIGIINIHLAEITIGDVLYQLEYKIVDGVEVQVATAPDGTTGTIQFKNNEPVFVPDATDGSGVVGLLMMLNLLILVSVLRRYQSRFFSIR